MQLIYDIRGGEEEEDIDNTAVEAVAADVADCGGGGCGSLDHSASL